MAEPLFLNSIVAHQWHCDHFGHLNSRHYAAAFDDALFLFWGQLGAIIPGRDEAGTIPVTAEMRTTFQSETLVGTIANLRGRVLRVGGKSVSLRLEMVEAQSDRPLATCEVVEVFFDMQARESRPIPDALRDRLLAAVDAAP
ncbi:acyl-CoA thioesterase [Azospirillum canadense]|uniref:acyl-CoA thioesterase n=1 Tax=Azospirillum canadense TaxID=403962 RepID=UPI002227DAFC|nr:thioesterase family protein [Azospirillum canadense]MCW2239416.1 acyl-CoA thioester hydrolase [Azospirillum canadense]